LFESLKAIDADVYGLMEIANNGYGPNSAIAHLTSALDQTQLVSLHRAPLGNPLRHCHSSKR
jgi:hypothetical protein